MSNVVREPVALTAVLEAVEDGWWQATCAEIPGAITCAETIEGARLMLADAIAELATS